MKLMIDMGNSSLKWAIFDGHLLSSQQSISYQGDDLEQGLTQSWHQFESKPTEIWVSNVAGPQKAHSLTQWVKTNWGFQPHFVQTSHYESGITNGYKKPEQLGVDRWLALIGAYQIEQGPLCVVDCGTAVTLDVVLADGHHLGGLISPGLITMQRALLKDTYALISHHQVIESQQFHFNSLLAQETQTGILLGSLYAVVGLLDYVITSFEKQGDKLMLILTGGNGPALVSSLRRPYRYIPDLVLQGLVVIMKNQL